MVSLNKYERKIELNSNNPQRKNAIVKYLINLDKTPNDEQKSLLEKCFEKHNRRSKGTSCNWRARKSKGRIEEKIKETGTEADKKILAAAKISDQNIIKNIQHREQEC